MGGLGLHLRVLHDFVAISDPRGDGGEPGAGEVGQLWVPGSLDPADSPGRASSRVSIRIDQLPKVSIWAGDDGKVWTWTGSAFHCLSGKQALNCVSHAGSGKLGGVSYWEGLSGILKICFIGCLIPGDLNELVLFAKKKKAPNFLTSLSVMNRCL